jgi:hypothetical protein
MPMETLQLQSCTDCGPAPIKTRRPGLGIVLRFAVGLAIVVVLTLGEVWVIERAPDLNVTVDAAADAAAATDSYVTPIRGLERDSPPVAVLH